MQPGPETGAVPAAQVVVIAGATGGIGGCVVMLALACGASKVCQQQADAVCVAACLFWIGGQWGRQPLPAAAHPHRVLPPVGDCHG